MLKRLHLPYGKRENSGSVATQPSESTPKHHAELCNHPSTSDSAQSRPAPTDPRKLSASSLSWVRRRSCNVNGLTPEDSLHSSPVDNGAVSDQVLSPPDFSADPLGLHLVHDPLEQPCVDIVFLHGLGGGSHRSWSWEHDHRLFWPRQWLPGDPKISKARIFTYGYNADFKASGRSLSTVTDFAKSLLFDIRFSRDSRAEDFRIGKYPIVFVAHSMGGLVIKKAILLGQHDSIYQDLVHSISAIIFLATPHRGAQIADSLQRVLQVTLRSAKDFITDLSRNSHALEDINEQFRHIAPNLLIWSFYETRPTGIAVSKIMVLERESSVLGYTGEISAQLDADHHNVCKYYGLDDPNYVKVLNAIRSTIEELKPETPSAEETFTDSDLRTLLRDPIRVENDLRSLCLLRVKDTCEWIWSHPYLQKWRSGEMSPTVLWCAAPPGSGKSICAAYVVEKALSQHIPCGYFFFRNDDQQRSSIAGMLKSLALQTAHTLPQYRCELGATLSTSQGFEKGDAQSIWRHLFLDILKRIGLQKPLFWVVDALDESESPEAFFNILHDISNENIPIRVFFTGRNVRDLNRAYRRLPRSLSTMLMDIAGSEYSSSDISRYAHNELQQLHASDELKEKVHQVLITRAAGNFLWVKLVLDELPHCHTEKDILKTLKVVPGDMQDLYQRIDQNMIRSMSGRDLLLTKTLLDWVICAPHPMTLPEMNQALSMEYPGLLNLGRTIQDTCGQFVVVDRGDRVTPVHLTARDYLLNTSRTALAVDRIGGSKKLLLTSLTALSDLHLRHELTQKGYALIHSKPFTLYASTTWSYYLRHVDPTDSAIIDSLSKFFKQSSVLCWIHLLVVQDKMDLMVRAAKAILYLVSENRKANSVTNPMLHRITDMEFLESWTTDLVKIVSKFNKHLRSDPLAVYHLLPAVCPLESSINQQFCCPGLTDVMISPADESWTDNLARFSLSGAEQFLELACAGPYIAVLAQGGIIHIWTTLDFRDVCRLKHTENVTAICVNIKGTMLAAYGLLTTKIWQLPSGTLSYSTPNPRNSRAMTLQFGDNDSKLLSGCDDRGVYQLALNEAKMGWQPFNFALLREDADVNNRFVNSPKCILFSPDGYYLAVSYRGFPLSVWAVDMASLVGRCRRVVKTKQPGSRTTDWFGVDQMTWNPISGHIIGLYKDGGIFKWHPLTDDYQEAGSTADEVTCSRDGKLFATSDTEGTIRVWNFAYFSVIYQLKSDDLVTGLSFSPDATRLYDIRGSVINAWEPNGLLRLAETEERLSDIASEDHRSTLTSQVSEETVTSCEALTSLALSPSQTKYCAGNEAGKIFVHCMITQCELTINPFGNLMDVRQVVWSQDSHRFATLDLGGDVSAHAVNSTGPISPKSLNVSSLGRPKHRLEMRTPHQIMLNHDGTMLAVVFDDQIRLWDIESSQSMLVQYVTDGTSAVWMSHPRDREVFLAFRYDSTTSFSWKSLDETARFSTMSPVSATVEQAVERTVTKVLISFDGALSVVQIRTRSRTGHIERHYMIISLPSQQSLPPPDLDSNTANDACTAMTARALPGECSAKIYIALGIVAGPRLIFLDQDFWVSSCPLQSAKPSQLHNGTDSTSVKRHYFIPRDWASAEALETSSVLDDGTLLAPRGGDLVTVKSKFGPV